MPNALCIIGNKDDSQAQNWMSIARSLSSRVAFFETCDIGKTWNLICCNEVCGILSHPSVFYPFNKGCWYYRGPLFADSFALTQFNTIHSVLAATSYPLSNYFNPSDIEARLNSKAFQHIYFGCFPESRIISRVSLVSNSQFRVFKSLSHVRSKVSLLEQLINKNYLCQSHGGPLMLQRVADGIPVKVHCYIMRDSSPLISAFACYSNDMDYRYSNTRYQAIDMSPAIRSKALELHELTGSRFFDFDISIDRCNKLTMFEMNFSPAPCFFEDQAGTAYEYSKQILVDWLI